MTPRLPILLLALLFSLCFTLATSLQPRSLSWRGQRAQADTMLKVVLGDGRRMFANHFFAKADAYFHSGYYPSIFDQAKLQCEDHLKGEETPEHPGIAEAPQTEAGHKDTEDEHDFMGKPKDWLERFSRKFRITEHAHLGGGGTERELLPWLKLSAEMDPHQIETYTVAAYWLRTRLHKVDEAEEFLREGLRANPDSHEILFELGRLLNDSRKDTVRARNVWLAALRKWQKNEAGKEEPDKPVLRGILIQLARLEEHEGNFAKAIEHLQQLQAISPNPDAIAALIQDFQTRLKNAPPKSGSNQP